MQGILIAKVINIVFMQLKQKSKVLLSIRIIILNKKKQR